MIMISTNEEDAKRVKALHQWLTSQDIPKHQWISMLAMAIGYSIWEVTHDDLLMTLRGQLLVTEMIARWSIKDMLNG